MLCTAPQLFRSILVAESFKALTKSCVYFSVNSEAMQPVPGLPWESLSSVVTKILCIELVLGQKGWHNQDSQAVQVDRWGYCV